MDRALHVFEEAARVDEFERVCAELHAKQSPSEADVHEAILKLGVYKWVYY